MYLSEPYDKNMRVKEDEKTAKYSSLAFQVRELHRVSTVVVLIAVCWLGFVSDQLEKNLDELDSRDILGGLQASAMFGTVNILEQVLSL